MLRAAQRKIAWYPGHDWPMLPGVLASAPRKCKSGTLMQKFYLSVVRLCIICMNYQILLAERGIEARRLSYSKRMMLFLSIMLEDPSP
uniref:Ij1 n=1 Tax=Arundo donax TaxID=35708 RepID=A0A0A9FZ48_ARUDO